MPVFWTVWAGLVLGLLALASFVEWNGARHGFQGANGIFLFASGYLTLLSLPVPFIVTWIGVGLGTAFAVCAIGALVYGLLFAAVLRLMSRLIGKPG